MTLIGNGKPDVRNRFLSDRKSNLHLVLKESQSDTADLPQEHVEVANTGTSNPSAASDSQSVEGPHADTVPAPADPQAISRTPKA
jgi:hypothetical protein